MAPTHNAVVVSAAGLDVELARSAAASFFSPHQTPERVVDDLLTRLQKTRRRRELKGLNHWSEFAPAYLQKLLDRAQARRRRLVERFVRSERETAVARAAALLGNRPDAEDVVGETFLELWQGRTSPAHFYRALRGNALNRRESLRGEARRTAPLDKIVTPAASSLDQVAWGPEGAETLSPEPPSLDPDDQDPLDILLAREEAEDRRGKVEKAKEIARGCRKYRWVRAKNWARDLEIGAAA